MDYNREIRPALAELIGTFTLVFIGAGAGAVAGASGIGVLGVAFAHGIALMVIIYAWGVVSGAHVNPAVTLGLVLTNKVSWVRAAFYWVAQFLGGIAAAALLSYLLSGVSLNGTPITGLGETIGALTAADPLRTMIIEAVLTFFLVAAVFGTGVSGRNGNAVGVAIGLVLTMDILMGGALTGASMNPARTLGPALLAGNLGYVWIYFVGPFVGAAAAAVLWQLVFLGRASTPPAPEPLARRRPRR